MPLTAVVGQAAVSDLEPAAARACAAAWSSSCWAALPTRVPDRYREASPARRLPLEVPTLLVHGGRDDTVPAAMSREFAAAAGCELAELAARRPLRAHRAGLARMGYGGRMARTAVTTRADAVALDAADPLAAFRDRFELGDGGRIYVDGNSLGALAHDAQAALEARIGEWGDRLVTGWHDWVDAPVTVGDRLAGPPSAPARGR